MITPFHNAAFRRHFPALQGESIYLDSAATALKPFAMIKATQTYYESQTATVHRSQSTLAYQVTQRYEFARSQVSALIHSETPSSIIWTKGATESLNLIAQGYFAPRLQADDEIIVSEQEHHANLLPWLMISQQTGARLIKWPVESNGELSLTTLHPLLNEKTRVVAVSQMSNVTGFQIDLGTLTPLVHQYDALIVVDGAQGIAHQPINVSELSLDFYVFSAHKLYGPTGLGVCYGKPHLLQEMAPWQGGGKMLKKTTFSAFIPEDVPACFEAGTPNIAGVIGFSATLEWLMLQDWRSAHNYLVSLTNDAEQLLSQLPGFISYRRSNSPILAFNFSGVHPQDIALLLAEQNIALRSGQHCTSPLMEALKIDGCLRASFLPYNRHSDIDALYRALQSALLILQEDD